MICNKCNAQIPDSSAFCPICGYNKNSSNSNVTKNKSSRFGLILGLVCAVLIIACCGVLIFSFMNLEGSAKAGDKIGFSSPEKAAEEFITALYGGDGEDMVNIIHPDCICLIDGLTEYELIERVDELEDEFDEEYGEGWYVRVDSSNIFKELSKAEFPLELKASNIAVSEACIVECNATLIYPDGTEDAANVYVTSYKIDGRWHALFDF